MPSGNKPLPEPMLTQFSDNILTCLLSNENHCIFTQFSLKFVPNDPIDNKSVLVHVMAWHRIGSKPVSPEPMMSQFTDTFTSMCDLGTLRPRQNGRHFADDTFKHILLNENVRISIEISLKFVPKGPINNIPALVQITAWRRPGDKPLSEPMVVRLLTHICFTQPQ